MLYPRTEAAFAANLKVHASGPAQPLGSWSRPFNLEVRGSFGLEIRLEPYMADAVSRSALLEIRGTPAKSGIPYSSSSCARTPMWPMLFGRISVFLGESGTGDRQTRRRP